MERGNKCLAVIRIRGKVGVRGKVQDTLKMLDLNRNFHATLIDNRPSYSGMLQKAQNEVTWGEASKETISALLREKARITGDKELTDEYLQKIGYDSFDSLASAIHDLKVEFRKLRDIKPIFRLHPPKKGFRGKVKISHKSGGESGYRGEAINEIITRMF